MWMQNQDRVGSSRPTSLSKLNPIQLGVVHFNPLYQSINQNPNHLWNRLRWLRLNAPKLHLFSILAKRKILHPVENVAGKRK